VEPRPHAPKALVFTVYALLAQGGHRAPVSKRRAGSRGLFRTPQDPSLCCI